MAYPGNPNCDGAYCSTTKGEVRVLPAGGDSNLILCYSCYREEIKFRYQRNKTLAKSCQFDLPAWTDLEVYQIN